MVHAINVMMHTIVLQMNIVVSDVTGTSEVNVILHVWENFVDLILIVAKNVVVQRSALNALTADASFILNVKIRNTVAAKLLILAVNVKRYALVTFVRNTTTVRRDSANVANQTNVSNVLSVIIMRSVMGRENIVAKQI